MAAILDFITVFAAGGVGIAQLTGGMTENGFQLEGLPALALFAIIAIGDFGWQRFSWYQRQKMTKQEMKDEFKRLGSAFFL